MAPHAENGSGQQLGEDEAILPPLEPGVVGEAAKDKMPQYPR